VKRQGGQGRHNCSTINSVNGGLNPEGELLVIIAQFTAGMGFAALIVKEL
jgi:hypothetical protein